MDKKLKDEVRRFQEIAGIKKEMELGNEPDQLEEDGDYDVSPDEESGDTDAEGDINEDGFSATMHAVEDDPVV